MTRPMLLAIVLVLVVSGCAPEPEATASSDEAARGTTASPSSTSASPSSGVTASTTLIALPASCDDLYSDDLLATLSAQVPPLNDPGLSDLLSTESVAGLDVLNSGVPTLRCTWGSAGSPGLATTVTQIDDDTSSGIEQQLSASGFTCGELSGETVCRISQETIDQNDQIRTNGETHWFGSGFWAATHWIDVDPEGYTEDIAAELAG